MAAKNLNELERLVGLLAAKAKFKTDYTAYANKTRKLLIVEGVTDEAFIKKIKKDTVDCIVANNVFNSDTRFRTTPTEPINCKNAIVKVIYGISHFPSPFIAYPDDLDKWDLYGLVDLDCDEIGVAQHTPRLFITDTRDLETLILYSDEEVWDKLDKCEISESDIKQSFFVAYQLSEVRALLAEHHDMEKFNLRAVSCGSRRLDFDAFVKENKISLMDIIKYIAKESGEALSAEKMKRMFAGIVGSKNGKKRFDAEGIWKQDISSFDISRTSDFWTSINGHDVLQLLQYYNSDACRAYNCKSDGLNRKFEFALIAAYDSSCFSKTKLHAKMKASGLVE